jgi:ABC-2 type transport system ATP-binding protein
MERKLAVAMGLVHRPQILFLDEPTSGLDPEARADVWQEVQHLAADEGLTILLTTHYLEEADHLAGRLAIIDRGRVVAIGTPAQLKGELHGDAIQIELAERADETVASALRAVGAIHEVKLDGCTVHARAKSGASALPAVLAALARSAVGVAAATVARPSLDDVYLRYAGRAFSAADAIGTDGKAASEQ